MATIKTSYAGAAATAITITLASLASAGARESNTVDNTSNLYLDALVQLRIKTNASVPASDKAVYVYAWGVNDPTTPIYPDAVTGSDAGITLQSPTQLPLLGVIFCPTASTTYTMVPKSIAGVFGGALPQKWGIVVVNTVGQAFDTTGGNFLLAYQGIYATSV